MRINLFLSRAGIASRRGADSLIEEGKVKLNGKILKKPGAPVDPTKDTIEVMQGSDWKKVTDDTEPILYALYKPRGYVTSMKKQGRDPIIKSLIPDSPRVFPVGRLDKESEGLLLLTNDGDFALKMTHPRKHIEKTYLVQCTIPNRFDENVLKSYLGRVAKGVRIDGRKTVRCEIELKRYLRKNLVELEITLREGRNRQIRRMLGTINLEVVRLIRTRIGNLTLDELHLPFGKWKEIDFRDVL